MLYSSNHETSDRKDSVNYEVVRPNRLTATYETLSLQEESASEIESKTKSDETSTGPIYSEVCNDNPSDDPPLQNNPDYCKNSEITDQS